MAAYCVTPTGELIIYNTANYALRKVNGKTELLTGKKGNWVADIPAGWAVGWHRPTLLFAEGTLREIKRALSNYNAKTGKWKD